LRPRTIRIVGLILLAAILGIAMFAYRFAIAFQKELEGTYGHQDHDTYYIMPHPIVILLGSLGLLFGLFAIFRPAKVCRIFGIRSATGK
jgi:hypothetical protein